MATVEEWTRLFTQKVTEGEITDWEREHFRKLPAVFRNSALSHLPEDAQILFGRLETALSPENLSCDGELSRTATTKKYRGLMREWKALEKKYKVKAEPNC